jgi:hypothetical protein
MVKTQAAEIRNLFSQNQAAPFSDLLSGSIWSLPGEEKAKQQIQNWQRFILFYN